MTRPVLLQRQPLLVPVLPARLVSLRLLGPKTRSMTLKQTRLPKLRLKFPFAGGCPASTAEIRGLPKASLLLG